MATATLLIWPFIAMAIFAALGPSRGLIWACIVGYLFLPEWEAFDLPALPAYGKYSVISFGLVLGIIVAMNKGGPRPETTDKTMRFVILALIAGLFLGIAGTIFDNTAPVIRAGRFQQGHSIRDLVSLGSELLIAIAPFLLARRWLSDPKFHADLLFAFVVLALVYSFLVLFEVRMSPQLNRWVYDFFPHSWRQHVRAGGFRPVVFLNHGLSVGFFLRLATVSAFAMVRHTSGRERTLYVFAGLWILVVLILSRNLGATMLAFIFVPVMLMLGRRVILWLVTGAALIFMLYPAARVSLPTERFVAMIESVSPSRAQSLEFRLYHEGKVLERAMQKPAFGWGGWGRGRIVDDRGRDVSVTDGSWVIQLANHGWVGYITYFGLIAAPIYFLRRRRQAPFATYGLAVIMAANLIYCIPNAETNPLTWLTAGTLAGYLQFGPRGAPVPGSPAPEPVRGRTRRMSYSRYAPNSREAGAPLPYRRSL